MNGTLVALEVTRSGSLLSPGRLASRDRALMGCLYGSSRPTTDVPPAVEIHSHVRLELDELKDMNAAVTAMFAGEDARGIVVF